MNDNLYTRALLAVTLLSVAGCGQSGSGGASQNDAVGGNTKGNAGTSTVGGQSSAGGTSTFASSNSSAAGSSGTKPTGGATSSTGFTSSASGGGGGQGSGGSSQGGATATGGAASTTDAGATTPAACSGGSAQSGDLVVKLSSLQQKISGFGASTAWYSSMSSGDADLLWSTTAGAGLSLHRVRIDYNTGHTSEVAIAQRAVAHGVTVWATPWTPPIADKSNGSSVEGTLSDGQAFATFLAGFVTYMKGQGVSIYAVSAQNEPDANVTYESCSYTGATLAAFIGSYMGPTLASLGVKIMAPETQNWCNFANYLNPILNDANANQYTDIIATHEYGCNVKDYPQIAQAGKEFWETEMYDTVTTEDAGMGSALRVAQLIHNALTVANMNAWHYWWVYPSSNDNGALWDKTTGKPSQRLWIMGNFSRFVRPGYQRVDVTGTAPSGVLVSAYTNPADGKSVVVAINNNTSASALSLFLSGNAACTVTPWVTSSNDSLASKASVTVTSSHFTYLLDPQSVTTLVASP